MVGWYGGPWLIKRVLRIDDRSRRRAERFYQRYGRIDIRAKLPEGQGIWPALWMLGSNIDDVGWPQCGEIDIMEYLGHQPWISHGTAHYDSNGHQYIPSSYSLGVSESFKDEFHVFSIHWDRNQITWYVDYNLFKSLTREQIGTTYPFNQYFFFIMNVLRYLNVSFVGVGLF